MRSTVALENGKRDKDTGHFSWPLCSKHSVRPCTECALRRPLDGPFAASGDPKAVFVGESQHRFTSQEARHLTSKGILSP